MRTRTRLLLLVLPAATSACSGGDTDDPGATGTSSTTSTSGSTSTSTSTSSTTTTTSPTTTTTAPVTCSGTGPTGNNPYKYAYWGDLHLHTSYSIDAYSFGTRTTPASAYGFAKGSGKVDIGSGTNAPPGPADLGIVRPLDFLAVTDHSEFLAVSHGCVYDPTSPYYDTKACKLVRSEVPAFQGLAFLSMLKNTTDLCGDDFDAPACVAQRRSAWLDVQKAAADAYVPCSFTSLIAYEWSAMAQHTYFDGAQNVTKSVTNHRNVVFAGSSVPIEPLDSLHYPTPPELWTALEQHCTDDPSLPDCDAITIPHNTNLSAGESLDMSTMTSARAAQQAKFQVCAEIYQHKGASECFYDPAAGYSDADCQFEYLSSGVATDPQPTSFLRTGLESGIGWAAEHPGDPNPLQVGFVGATDDHNGAAGNVEEAAYVGHVGRIDDAPALRLKGDVEFGPGAITGVWAEQNTRESIYAAVRRRETFATSGPRIQVRFFATTADGACADPDFPKAIVDAGAARPMGSVVGPADLAGAKAKFALAVWPDTAPQALVNDTTAPATIAAVQLVKAHVAKGGGAVVEDAPLVVPGVPPTGGCVVIEDAGFDPDEYAVWYLRVLQEPTWRWSHHDCVALKASDPDWATNFPGCAPGGDLDVAVQERAWTSPIWYEP